MADTYSVWANQFVLWGNVLHCWENSAAIYEDLSRFFVSIFYEGFNEVETKEDEDQDQNHWEALKDCLGLVMVENDGEDTISQ